MKTAFYPRLAWMGIWKNKRLYIPYILASMGMVMMFYIVAFLNTSKVLRSVSGGDVVQQMLGLGLSVISVFSLLFLFYTNSFLNRRRKKEFGLYNILGMGKWNLARILVWESLMSTVISLAGGLAAGIVFSKFAELGMVNLLHGEVSFLLTFEPKAILETLKRFSVIFLLLLLYTLWQIRLASPMELLHSENAGEKPPKANWVLALAGAVILGAAYYLAVTIQEPIDAMLWFFVAVIMVIIATYLLFIAGSVTICCILQKNKNYYYKTNHFVSVSSMVYRMKRNGAGLASICILCTMVLVMLSGTVCLYIGTEDSLRTRYPRNIDLDTAAVSVELLENGKTDEIRELVDETIQMVSGQDSDNHLADNEKSVDKSAAEGKGLKAENILDYRTAEFAGYIDGGKIYTDDTGIHSFQARAYADIWQIFMVPVEDYNRLMNQEETLEPGEVLLYTTKAEYGGDTISIHDGETMKIKKKVSEFVDNGADAMQIIPSMYLFVPDLAESIGPLEGLTTERGNPIVGLHWIYGFDLDCKDEVQIQIQNQLENSLSELSGLAQEGGEFSVSCGGDARERAYFYGLYGGLFFLGILLGAVFVFAAVLIIYYKQISEGYEDQSRFEIMQKVGMTRKDIKKSINSQVLTVFFLPLLTAGIHLAFAFPLIYKMLILFSLTNLRLLIVVTIGCYLIFAFFYMLVYRITSKGYYHIVSPS